MNYKILEKTNAISKYSLSLLLYFFISSLFSQSISVTNPAPGDRVDSCTNQTINWTSSDTSDYYNIYYSIDDGLSWVTIASSYNTIQDSFEWDVPNVSTVNALIKVEDALDDSIFDTNDGVFIIDGSLILLYPTGDENFVTGNTVELSYSYNDDQVQNIKIEYSVDDGENWITEINSTPATGTYQWVVPNLPNTSLTKIRLSDTQDSSCKVYENENNFSIISTVTLLYPNGGEVLTAKVGNQGNTVIMNNGPESLNSGSFYDDGGLQNNYSGLSHQKTFSPDFPTNKIRITFQSYNLEEGDKIYIYDGDDDSDQLLVTLSGDSNGQNYYTATNDKGQLTVKFVPDGDNNFDLGWDSIISSIGSDPYNVNWSIVGTSNYFNLDYSVDEGNTWTRIVSNYFSTTGTYSWQVPNTPTTQGRFRITDAGNGNIVDISDANFTIEAASPFIIVDTPDGGEEYYPDQYVNIEWRSAFFTGDVKVDYSINNGSDWINVIASTPSSSNSFGWLIPSNPSDQVLIKLSDVSNSEFSDQSDEVFTIYNYIKVTTPDGDTLTRCSSDNIEWKAGATSGVYDIEWSIDDTNWNTVVSGYGSSGNGDHSYAWSIPNVLTDNLKVRVTDAANNAKTDTSDASTVATPPDPVILLSPNGGESLIAGTQQTATYTYGSSTTSVSFNVSYDGGATWESLSIDNGSADGSATFTVPNVPSSQAKIRVIGNQYNGCDYDDSDQTFTIVSSVSIVQPNGGENWQATVGTEGQGQDIAFSNATRVVNTARVNKPHTNENYTQTFYPDNPLNKLRLRMDKINTSNYQRLRIYSGVPGQSDYNQLAQFYNTNNQSYPITETWTSSHETGAITIVTEQGGSKSFTAQIESVGTDTKQINWDIVGTSNRFNIDYSVDEGNTWNPIVIDYPNTTGTYEWQVPNAASTQARVRVTDAEQPLVVDMSDANFTIEEAEIIVLDPNGNEKLYHDQIFEIKWIYPDCLDENQSQNISIDYSLNAGVTWINIVENYSNNGSFNWTIPDVDSPKPQSLIRVRESSNNDKFDISDNFIEIRPRIVVTSPNDNSSLFQSCTESSITWFGGASDSYKIELSIDGGNSWEVVNNNFNSSSIVDGVPFYSFDWSIPNSPSTTSLVKISEIDDVIYYDLSDEEFTISPSVTITSPTENQNLGSLSSIDIIWETNYTSDIFNIDYSIDFGDTWINIVTEQEFNTYIYNWDISNVDNSNILIKVTDFISPCKYDINSISLGLIENIILSNSSINENEPVNSVIGNFTVQGNGSGDYSFELTSGVGDDNNSEFTIVDNGLYSNAIFDYETDPEKSIRVRLNDLVTNEIFDMNFIITINDVNDTDYPLGDCNGDFEVSILDIVILVDYISGLNPEGFLIENADVNFDGNIDVIDIVGIVDIIMGNDFSPGTDSFTSVQYEASLMWDDSLLIIDSETSIAGLQLVFEDEFEFELNQIITDNFEYVSFIKDDKFTILLYNTNGYVLNPGVNIILESLSDNLDLIDNESIGVNNLIERVDLIFNQSLSVNNQFNSNVRLFPIPTTDFINFIFNSSNVITNAEYQIFNSNGQLLLLKKSIPTLNRDHLILDLAPGIYFIKIISTTKSGKINSSFKEIIIK